MRVLITAGPTREHLDPVRFLSNGSSGKMGFALAAVAARRGWDVDLVTGPVSLPTPPGVRRLDVVSADDMLEVASRCFPAAQLLLAVAAVADFKPAEPAARKVKGGKGAHTLSLVPTVDVLRTLAGRRQPGQTVVGFAAETHDVETYALGKLREKQLDWIVANDVSRPDLGMNADDNAVILLGRAGQRLAFGPANKTLVAEFLLQNLVSTGV